MQPGSPLEYQQSNPRAAAARDRLAEIQNPQSPANGGQRQGFLEPVPSHFCELPANLLFLNLSDLDSKCRRAHPPCN